MALKQNISIDKGATFVTTFEVTNANDVPVDFSSSTMSGSIKKHFESANSVSLGVTGDANGIIVISLSATQTSQLDPGRYMYDVYSTDGELITRIVEGIASVNPGVTK